MHSPFNNSGLDMSIPSFGAPVIKEPPQPASFLPIVSYSHAQPTRFAIVEMNILDAGVYNDQHVRAFEAHVDQHVIENFQRVIDSCNSVGNIPSQAVASVATSFIQLSATPHSPVIIPNGWSTQRFRFKLTVEEVNNLSASTRIRHIFQGFSEAHDASLSGFINPKLNFYINSFMTVSREEQMTNTGVVISDRIVNSGQLMDTDVIHRAVSNNVALMRPSDLMSTAQDTYGFEMQKSTVGAIGRIYDQRSSLTSASTFNKRTNNMVSSYTVDAVNAMKKATAFEQFGESNENKYGRAWGSLYDKSVTDNPFMVSLGSRLGINAPSCRFTLETLKSIDTSFVEPNYDKYVGQAVKTLVAGLDSANWNSPDNVTRAAASLANEIPALASELMIHMLEFSVSNSTIDGNVEFKWVTINSTSGNAIDLQRIAYMFQERLKSETLNTISYNNYLKYACYVKYNVFDNLQLKITIDGSPLTDYVKPVYCDSLATPILAPNNNYVAGVVHSMEKLFNHLDFTASTADNLVSGLDTSIPKIIL